MVQPSLLERIRQEKRAGHGAKDITSQLLDEGYDSAVIEQALTQVYAREQSRTRKKMYLWGGIIFVGVLIIIFLVMLLSQAGDNSAQTQLQEDNLQTSNQTLSNTSSSSNKGASSVMVDDQAVLSYDELVQAFN